MLCHNAGPNKVVCNVKKKLSIASAGLEACIQCYGRQLKPHCRGPPHKEGFGRGLEQEVEEEPL